METIKVLEAAARRECPECKGKGGFGAPGWEDDPDEYYGDCRDCEGTGLWLPMLSEKCPGRGNWYSGTWHTCHQKQPDGSYSNADCGTCKGTGRVLNLDNPEDLDAAAEKLGHENSHSYGVVIPDSLPYHHNYTGDIAFQQGAGSTRIEARKAAFAAVVKAVWPEVEYNG